MEVFITNISYILAKIISEQIIFCDWLCNKTGFSHKIGQKKTDSVYYFKTSNKKSWEQRGTQTKCFYFV